MKHLFLFLVLSIFIFFACKKDKEDTNTTTPPYSYTSSDIAGIGDTFRIAYHTVNTGDTAYKLGVAASGQTWDYDSIPFSTNIDTSIFLNPTTSPDYGLFSASNLLLQQGQNQFMFLNKTSQQVDVIGISNDFGGGNIVKDTLGNLWTVLKFPMQMGASYTDSGSVVADVGTNRVKMKYKIVSSIDASGTVKTPTGTYTCIRNKRIEYVDMNLFAIVLGQEVPITSSKDTTYKYVYWTKSKKWNVIEIETDQNDVIKQIGYLLE